MQAKLLVVAVVAACSLAWSAGAATISHLGGQLSNSDQDQQGTSRTSRTTNGGFGWKIVNVRDDQDELDLARNDYFETKRSWIDGPASAAVPEPAAWAIMLIGFFGVGTVFRSVRRSVLNA